MFNYINIPSEQCDFIDVAGVDELPDGERLFLEIDAFEIVLFKIAEHYYAISDLCTHDDGPLGDGTLDKFEIICPRHGARFDIRNGKALTLPAVEDIPAFPIRIDEGRILLGLPK